MIIHRFLIGLVMLTLVSYNAVADSTNPFAKTVAIDIGKGAGWVIKDQTATKTGNDSGTYYHLFYDKRVLRLRMGTSPDDSEAAAKKYDQLAIEDVMVDGKRLPLFQWCLVNQERHSRFLQQGLSVRKGICVNDGAKGAFVMRLNTATVDSLTSGSKLTFVFSPYRTSMTLNFDISDFKVAAEKLTPKAVAKKPEPAPEKKKCEITPPNGFAMIPAKEYACGNEEAKKNANASMAAAVNVERERKKKQAAAAEARRKKLEEENKKELAAKKAQEEKLAAEAEALATSAAQQEAIGGEISSKMIAVCKKKWEIGEHRCYCERFLEHAPAGIESDPTCK